MEAKMITIPFEVDLAKKIQAGEEPGKIVTRDGRNVRVVCWDRQDDTYPIIALLWNKERSNEACRTYMDNGCLFENGEENQYDLTLQIHEWTQFKDGDILATENGSCCILNANGEFKTSCYAGVFQGELAFGGAVFEDCIEIMTYATEEQKQQLIDALKQSTDPRAKEYLKRFFGIEKPDCEFEFLQPVLVRANPLYQWLYGNFTHMSGELHFVSGGIGYKYCIPYNEQTKHLLGTTDNWEE